MRITVAWGKGGTGKSMVATSFAFEYSENRKTFLVDVAAGIGCSVIASLVVSN